MPTRLHRRPTGSRARLLSLLALAAAFLLVPAGGALADHGGGENPHLKVNLIGEEGGGGEVLNENFSVGTPPLECWLPEGGGSEQQGVCENEMAGGGNEFVETMEQRTTLSTAHPAPSSEHVKWEFITGLGLPAPGQCGPGDPVCNAATSEEDVEVNVIFKCREGKECPGVPLTLKKTGTGEGTVESSPEPDGIECDRTCKEETIGGFIAGSTTTLTATPYFNSSFDGWHGADAEAAGCDPTGATATCEVVMSEAREVEAQFDELIPHALTVEATGEGSVSAAAQPVPQSGEIAGCEEAGGSCSAEYGEGQTVTLQASPGAEKIAEWTGCTSAKGNTCEVVIPAEDATVKAQFVEAPKGTLTVQATGEGSVDATEPPPSSGEISGCEEAGGACSAEYFQGEIVTLVATPGEHRQVAWTGCDAEPEADECEVEVNAAEVTVKAAFTAIEHELTVAVGGQGSVGADSGAISGCREAAGTCAGTYVEGTLVTLEATPDAGHELSGWEGCDSEPGGSCQVTMGEAREVKAAFAAEPEEEKEEEPEEKEEGGEEGGGGSTPPPPPPPPPATCLTNPLLCQPGTLIAGRVAKVKAGVALLRARCLGEPGASCKGLAKLYAKLPSARKGRKARRAGASARRAKRRARLVLIGKARFALPAGASKVLRVRIANGKAKRLLRNGRALKAQLRGAGLRNRVVVLKPATKRRKRG